MFEDKTMSPKAGEWQIDRREGSAPHFDDRADCPLLNRKAGG